MYLKDTRGFLSVVVVLVTEKMFGFALQVAVLVVAVVAVVPAIKIIVWLSECGM